MQLSFATKGLGHCFGNKFLFRDVSLSATTGSIHVITGPNGSGKSTMLRILSGAISPDEGTTSFSQDGKALEDEILWQNIAFIAPYQELPEEFSLTELIDFQNSMHRKNAEFTDHLNFAEKFGLIPFMNKPIREFSTGMKQKAKFILAMGSGRRIWLLDEPGSNLDQAACQTLHELLREKAKECLVILATNDPAELALGPVMIHL